MADPHEFDDVMPENTSRREPEEPVAENLFTRLIYMIIIALMISFAGTVIGVLAFLQFVIMAFSNKQPNERRPLAQNAGSEASRPKGASSSV